MTTPPDTVPASNRRKPRFDWPAFATAMVLGTAGGTICFKLHVPLAFMIGAKLANVGVPLLLKELVDTMSLAANDARALTVVPAALLLAYGALRLSTALFTELRELVFAKATEGAVRSITLQVFRHLHDLSLRFHLERQTGGVTRDIERGTRAINSLMRSRIANDPTHACTASDAHKAKVTALSERLIANDPPSPPLAA